MLNTVICMHICVYMCISTIKIDEKFRWRFLLYLKYKDSTFTEVLCLRDHAVTIRSVVPPTPVGRVLSYVLHFCGDAGQALYLQGLQIPMGNPRSPAGLSTPSSEPLTDRQVHGHPWFTDRWESLLNLPPVNSSSLLGSPVTHPDPGGQSGG